MTLKLLFNDGALDATLNATLRAALKEIDSWDEDQLLGQPETEVIDYLVEKHSVRCPVLGDPWMDLPADIKKTISDRDMVAMYGHPVEVTATRVVVHIPFEGEHVFFTLRPNSFTHNPPRATIGKDELTILYEERSLDAEAIGRRIQSELQEIEKWLGWSRAMAENHNGHLPDSVRSAVQTRKERILANRATAGSIGIPIRQRGEATTPPLRRKTLRTEPRRPKPAAATFEAEPAMDAADYEEAIRLIRAAGTQMERSPSTTRRQSEEERRDWILVTLNSQFEGASGGEVFNAAGKTDILIRVRDRNVFIGECKIWRGPKQFAAAIDQLLSYLVWRDGKAALIVFIETRDATAVIDKAVGILTFDKRCRRAIAGGDDAERRDFIFMSDADSNREVKLAFLPIVIRPDADQSE